MSGRAEAAPEYVAAIGVGDVATVQRLLAEGHPPRFDLVADPDLVDLLLDAGADPITDYWYGSKPTDYLSAPCLRRLIARGLGPEAFRKQSPVVDLLFEARDRDALFDLVSIVDRDRFVANPGVHRWMTVVDDGRVFTLAYGTFLVEWVRDGSTYVPARWAEFDRELVAVEQDRADPSRLAVTARATGALMIGVSDLVVRHIRYPGANPWTGGSNGVPKKVVSMPDGAMFFGTRNGTHGAPTDAGWSDIAGLVVMRWTQRDVGDSCEFELVAGGSEAELERIWVDPEPSGRPGQPWDVTESGGLAISLDGASAAVQTERYNNAGLGGPLLTFVDLVDPSSDTASYRLRKRGGPPGRRWPGSAHVMTPAEDGIWVIDGPDLVGHRHDGETYRRPLPQQTLDIRSTSDGIAALTDTGIHHWQP